MNKEFESELAKRVVGKKGHRLGRKASAFAVAIAVSAVMIASAAFSFAEDYEATVPDWANQPTMDSDVIFDQHEDYITGTGGEVDIKKTMTLKNKTMEAQGSSHTSYTGFNYSFSISINSPDGAALLASAYVGNLSIAIDKASAEEPIDGTVTGQWELVLPDPESAPIVVPVDEVMSCGPEDMISFQVPGELSEKLADGCRLSLNVTVMFGEAFLSGDVTEDWWAEGYEIDPCSEHVGTFDPVPSAPGPTWQQ